MRAPEYCWAADHALTSAHLQPGDNSGYQCAVQPLSLSEELACYTDTKMNSRTLKRIAMVGLLLFLGGFIWGVHFVGVPYQDPTPAQRAYEALHGSISGWLMGAGICVLMSSALFAVARIILIWSRGRAAR
jgi:hypothetical protein